MGNWLLLKEQNKLLPIWAKAYYVACSFLAIIFLQASDRQTLRVRVLLAQASCLDGAVVFRDEGLVGFGDVNASRLVARFGFFDRAAADLLFNTTGPSASFVLEAPSNASCRLNVELDVVALGERRWFRADAIDGDGDIPRAAGFTVDPIRNALRAVPIRMKFPREPAIRQGSSGHNGRGREREGERVPRIDEPLSARIAS